MICNKLTTRISTETFVNVLTCNRKRKSIFINITLILYLIFYITNQDTRISKIISELIAVLKIRGNFITRGSVFCISTNNKTFCKQIRTGSTGPERSSLHVNICVYNLLLFKLFLFSFLEALSRVTSYVMSRALSLSFSTGNVWKTILSFTAIRCTLRLFSILKGTERLRVLWCPLAVRGKIFLDFR